ncbi:MULTISPECIES: hypothetical protein [Streptomyces]|uniref:Uncharacterized protein n=2 Tax=Streptomyces TaxID=1883 RepID=A0ABU4KGR0_9ACTN|nr:hypothetical protein [Streptomyces roseolus]MDX2296907.1 hypothetical protein [Streptomyces roseolus]
MPGADAGLLAVRRGDAPVLLVPLREPGAAGPLDRTLLREPGP